MPLITLECPEHGEFDKMVKQGYNFGYCPKCKAFSQRVYKPFHISIGGVTPVSAKGEFDISLGRRVANTSEKASEYKKRGYKEADYKDVLAVQEEERRERKRKVKKNMQGFKERVMREKRLTAEDVKQFAVPLTPIANTGVLGQKLGQKTYRIPDANVL